MQKLKYCQPRYVRDIGRYCILKIKCLAVNGTGGALSIRAATVPSDRLKGSEGREGVKTLLECFSRIQMQVGFKATGRSG